MYPCRNIRRPNNLTMNAIHPVLGSSLLISSSSSLDIFFFCFLFLFLYFIVICCGCSVRVATVSGVVSVLFHGVKVERCESECVSACACRCGTSVREKTGNGTCAVLSVVVFVSKTAFFFLLKYLNTHCFKLSKYTH